MDTIKNTMKMTCKKLIVGGAIGSCCVFVTSTLAGTAIPWAMTTYGSIIPGVGTIHASATAGGIAANLQVINLGLLSAKAITTCTVIGACYNTIKPQKKILKLIKAN